jgi:long-subunit fatty acid transport protein
MATLGAKFRLADWLSLGARVQSPLVQLSGQANTFSSTDTTRNGVVTTTDREDRPDQDATYQLPLDSTLGAAFTPTGWLELLADVSFQAGTSYTNVRNSVFSSSVDADSTFRYNLGVQFNLSPAWSILTGGYYNPSAIHSLDANRLGDSQLDFWGASLGVIWSVDHVQTGIGAVYFTGSGSFRTNEGVLNDTSVSGLGALLTTAYVF